MADTETEFKDWMDQHGVTAEQAAKALGVSEQTVRNWRSIGVPERRRAHVNYYMRTWAGAAAPPASLQPLVLNPSRQQFRTWELAARRQGFDHLEDWAVQGLELLAKEWEAGGLKALPDPEHSARVAEGEN